MDHHGCYYLQIKLWHLSWQTMSLMYGLPTHAEPRIALDIHLSVPKTRLFSFWVDPFGCSIFKIFTWFSQVYWNWSWDELVSDELPAMFQYVYNETGQKLHYVGHSQVNKDTVLPVQGFFFFFKQNMRSLTLKLIHRDLWLLLVLYPTNNL